MIHSTLIFIEGEPRRIEEEFLICGWLFDFIKSAYMNPEKYYAWRSTAVRADL
jgi:hypothetical protein